MSEAFGAWRVLPSRWLPRPRLERERFSGGRNLSAAARNQKRIEDARKIYVMKDTWTIVVPEWYLPEFMQAMRAAGVGDTMRIDA